MVFRTAALCDATKGNERYLDQYLYSCVWLSVISSYGKSGVIGFYLEIHQIFKIISWTPSTQQLAELCDFGLALREVGPPHCRLRETC